MSHSLPISSIDFRYPLRFPESLSVEVMVGDRVKMDQLVAKGLLPKSVTIALCELLQVKPTELKGMLKKQVGDMVAVGEVIAEKNGWGGKKQIMAKDAGKIMEIADDGIVTLQTGEEPLEVISPLGGEVSMVEPGKVEIKTTANRIVGHYGWGIPSGGQLVMAVEESETKLEWLDRSMRGCLLVMKGKLFASLWHKAAALGVKGIICGNVPSYFESWTMGLDDDEMVLISLTEEEMMSDELYGWLEKQSGNVAFIIPERKELIVTS